MTVRPKANPLRVKIGNTADLEFLCQDKDGNAIATLATLTEAVFQVRDKRTGALILEKRLTNSGEMAVDTPSTGYITVYIFPDDLVAVAAKRYFFGLELTWNSADEYELDSYVDNMITEEFEVVQDIVR